LKLTRVFNEVNNAVNKYIDLKESITDSDLFVVAQDSMNLVRFVNSATTFIANKKMMAFLKGLSISENLSVEEARKLTDYINSQEKAEYISTAFSKVFQSNSTSACFIMGKILNSVIEKGKLISHEELIAFNTLIFLFDQDLDNFKIIIEFIDEEAYSYKSLPIIDIETVYSYLSSENISSNSMYLTIEKLLSNGILFKDYEANTDFSKTEIATYREDYGEYQKILNPPKTKINENYELSHAGLILKDIIENL
jgi:hypothetical protein